MSSWDRSRNIPWSRIEQGGEESPERHRERVWKELRQEAALQKATKIQANNINQNGHKNDSDLVNSSEVASVGGDSSAITTFDAKANIKPNILGLKGQPFVMGDCFKQGIFGATLGSITGAAFGFMDGMRQAGESPILKKASNSAKGKFLFQGTSRSGMLFGAFFGSFHLIRYGVRVIGDPGEYTEITVAGVASLGAMLAKPTTRASLPYASMLVIMDAFNTYMSKEE